MARTTFHPNEILRYTMLHLTIQHHIQLPAHHIKPLLHINVAMRLRHLPCLQISDGNLRYRTATFLNRQQHSFHAHFVGRWYGTDIG